MNPFYKTTNQDYNPVWQLTNDTKPENYSIPSFKEVLDKKKKFEYLVKTIKNETLKKEFNMENEDVNVNQEDKLKSKLDSNVVVSKNFNINANEMNYPEHSWKIGNELYMTSNMDYGRLKPTQFEINNKWYPKNNQFSQDNHKGIYKNNGLNTGITKSKVNNLLDTFD